MGLTRILFGVGLIVLFLAPSLRADDDAVLYDRAQRLLGNKKYSEAYEIFSTLAEKARTSPTPMAGAYQYYRAKTMYHAGHLDQAQRDFEFLLTQYNRSPYAPHAHCFLGHINYRKGRIDSAILAYINALRLSVDNRLDNVATKSLTAMLADYPDKTIEIVSLESLPSQKKCKLMTTLSESLVAAGNYRPVERLLTGCTSSEATRLAGEARRLASERLEVGVVLPLSGELQKFGEAILDGINLMGERFGKESRRTIRTVLYDTKGDPLETGRIIHRLASGGVTAAIGPLTSEEAAVASAVLACGDMPLIIPAATQAGLTELATSSFQMRPNLEWQGIKMADFAIERLHADTAAIITPTSPENLLMARAFAKRFESKGGKVLGVEYFRSSENDFGSYIKDIKVQIMKQLQDSLPLIDEEGDTIEAEAVPVRVDCLYIPAEASQLRMILPQIDFYNLSGVFLGGDGWGNEAVFSLGERVLGENYYTSGQTDNDSTSAALKFAADFEKKYGRKPGFLERLGYDAMGLVCQAFRLGFANREDISRHLAQIKAYSGTAGIVSFGANRENIALPIYSIREGVPREVEVGHVAQ